MSRPKPYTLNGEPDSIMVDQLEEMLNIIFTDVELGGAHALLSSTHTDVVTGTVSRGALLIGNSTPAWASLVIGASGRYLRSDGTDAAWTAITELDITDGALLARVADAETVSGAWRFSTAPFTSNGVAWSTRNAGDSVTVPLIRLSSTSVTIGDNATNNNSFVTFGIGGASKLEMSTTALYGINNDQITLGDSGRIYKEIWANDCFLSQSIQLSGLISPSALGSGNNNNYNPTSLSDAFALRLTGNATTSVLTGVTAPVAGRLILLINIGTPTINITSEDTNSTAGNRIVTATGRTRLVETGGTIALWYDTTSSRWREWGGQSGADDSYGVYKSADESVTNSTTLQDDDHLFVNVVAGGKYYFKFTAFTTSLSATAGVKVAVAGTATATTIKAQISIWNDTTNSLGGTSRVAALGTGYGALVGAGDNYAEIEGTIDVNAAGTLRLQWAQNTADAVNAVTVQTGSSMTVKRLS